MLRELVCSRLTVANLNSLTKLAETQGMKPSERESKIKKDKT